jgi:hypothetical protein
VLKPGKGGASCSACGAEARDGRDALRTELERLKDQLASTRETILRMHEREERVKQRSVSSILYLLYEYSKKTKKYGKQKYTNYGVAKKQ